METTTPDVIAYCGLCCLDCSGHTGKIQDLAGELKRELEKARFDKLAQNIANVPGIGKPFGQYAAFYELLGTIAEFRCTKTCRNGGGPPVCEIRKCCGTKKIAGCWKCDEPETCQKLKFLEAVHEDAHLKNIRTIRKKGADGFMAGTRYW